MRIPLKQKWGFVATNPGAALEFSVDSRVASSGPRDRNRVVLSYLASYEGMGVGRVECVAVSVLRGITKVWTERDDGPCVWGLGDGRPHAASPEAQPPPALPPSPQGCECEPIEIDALWSEKASMLMTAEFAVGGQMCCHFFLLACLAPGSLVCVVGGKGRGIGTKRRALLWSPNPRPTMPAAAPQATQHAECRVRVSVQRRSSGEGHKFKASCFGGCKRQQQARRWVAVVQQQRRHVTCLAGM